MHCPALISMLFYVCCFALQFNDLFGTARKNYASCLKYATNCRFLPILKKGKAQKSLKLLSYFGISTVHGYNAPCFESVVHDLRR